MQPEPRLGDIRRILFGDTSALFTVEVAIRLVVLYAILVIAMRLMGRRVASQLSRNELIAVASLAAAVGPAVGTPEQGLLPPIIVAAWVVCMQRIMAFASFRSGTFEHLMQGEAVTLLADGRLDPAALQRNAISRDTLYAALRGQGVMTLGSLERVYLEPDGSFTVMRAMSPRPGLTVVPAWDRELIEEQAKSSEQRACEWCGTITPTRATAQPCSFCASTTWTSAVEARFRSPAGT